jgi:hypothetical protein
MNGVLESFEFASKHEPFKILMNKKLFRQRVLPPCCCATQQGVSRRRYRFKCFTALTSEAWTSRLWVESRSQLYAMSFTACEHDN